MAALDALDPDAVALYGGKACGLARLWAAGVPVPAGFAVEARADGPARWDPSDLAALGAHAAPLLRLGAVAVRSSAPGEDSARRSFAGLFETVLGARTQDELLRAVDRCVASGASERVRAYAGESLPVGVVVQSQLEPVAAGVCFTRDPSGQDGAVVLEAVAGLGDKLVAGHAEPERWRVYASGLGKLEAQLSARLGASVLTEREASRVAEEAMGIERKLGAPLDLEWAIDAQRKLWWLQARPVTKALEPPRWIIARSHPDVDDGPVTLWSNWNVRETLPEPLYPLTWTFWRDVIVPMVTNQLFGIPRASRLMPYYTGLDLVHGRLYFNMNAVRAVPIWGRLIGSLVGVVDAEVAEVVHRAVREGVLTPRRVPGSRMRIVLGMAQAALLSAGRMASGIGPRRALRVLEQDGWAIASRGDVARLTDAELVEEMQLFDRPLCRRLRNGLQMMCIGMLFYAAARRAFRHHPDALDRLTTGIAADPTTQISIELDALAERATPLADLFETHGETAQLVQALGARGTGRAWLSAFDAFLARFGHRGPREFDMGAPRWSEDPSMLLDLVRARLCAPGAEPVAARLERLRKERQAAVEAAAAAEPVYARPMLRYLARMVERYMPLREAPKHYGLLTFQRQRLSARELGRRLLARGVLSAADDIFFLEWPEVRALAEKAEILPDLRSRVAERKAAFERFRRERPPDHLRSDGVPVIPPESPAAQDGALAGTGVSAGLGRGPVRVLRSPDARLLREGDVLVLEYADPGWTPLFPRASAVVMEVGGLMCHAAVVARELGIPAVFGVRDATRRLADGLLVEVDGKAGTVRPATHHAGAGSR